MSSMNSTCFTWPKYRSNDRGIIDCWDALIMSHTTGTKANQVPGTKCCYSVLIHFTCTTLCISQRRKLRHKEVNKLPETTELVSSAQRDAKCKGSHSWAQAGHSPASWPLSLYRFLYFLILQKLHIHKRDKPQWTWCVHSRVFIELFTKKKTKNIQSH